MGRMQAPTSYEVELEEQVQQSWWSESFRGADGVQKTT